MAQSHFGLTGAATAIGEQPLKGLINPAAMARLCLGEALTNLVWAESTGLADIKASVNWMYAAKMASEGVAMYEAATALKEAMIELQVRRCLCVCPCQHPCPDVCLPREQRMITIWRRTILPAFPGIAESAGYPAELDPTFKSGHVFQKCFGLLRAVRSFPKQGNFLPVIV